MKSILLFVVMIVSTISVFAKHYTFYKMYDGELAPVYTYEISDKFKVYEDIVEDDINPSYERSVIVAETDSMRIIIDANSYIAWSLYDPGDKIIALGGADGTYDPNEKDQTYPSEFTFDIKDGNIYISSSCFNTIEDYKDNEEHPIVYTLPIIIEPMNEIKYGDFSVCKIKK